jgi:hypothetical protein
MSRFTRRLRQKQEHKRTGQWRTRYGLPSQYHWSQGKHEFIMDENHFYYRSEDDTRWNSATATTHVNFANWADSSITGNQIGSLAELGGHRNVLQIEDNGISGLDQEQEIENNSSTEHLAADIRIAIEMIAQQQERFMWQGDHILTPAQNDALDAVSPSFFGYPDTRQELIDSYWRQVRGTSMHAELRRLVDMLQDYRWYTRGGLIWMEPEDILYFQPFVYAWSGNDTVLWHDQTKWAKYVYVRDLKYQEVWEATHNINQYRRVTGHILFQSVWFKDDIYAIRGRTQIWYFLNTSWIDKKVFLADVDITKLRGFVFTTRVHKHRFQLNIKHESEVHGPCGCCRRFLENLDWQLQHRDGKVDIKVGGVLL